MAEARLGVILPAAGGSARLGQPKQLLEVAGEALVARAVRQARSLAPARIVVVTGASAVGVSAALAGLPVDIRHNADWRLGLAGSIATGARALPEDIDAILVMLCDQWAIEAGDLHALWMHWRDGRPGISAARHGSTIGPPAIFARRFLPALCGLRGTGGARSLVEANLSAARFVDMPAAFQDLDTEEDLARLESVIGEWVRGAAR